MKLEENDIVMIHHNVGQMAPGEIDKYCEKAVRTLTSIFGKGRVALFPVREGNAWEFTIVKKPIKKSYKKHL